ncbi:MAG: pantothenate kinase, partial [Casimicrobiaceae bacterium]
TETNIRAGVMFGAADAIDGLVARIKAEWPNGETPIVIATGGVAEAFRNLCRSFDIVDPYLTLTGLNLAFGLLVK